MTGAGSAAFSGSASVAMSARRATRASRSASSSSSSRAKALCVWTPNLAISPGFALGCVGGVERGPLVWRPSCLWRLAQCECGMPGSAVIAVWLPCGGGGCNGGCAAAGARDGTEKRESHGGGTWVWRLHEERRRGLGGGGRTEGPELSATSGIKC